jgi:hypothetical protein
VRNRHSNERRIIGISHLFQLCSQKRETWILVVVGSTNETKKFMIVFFMRNPLRISKRAHTFVTQGPTNTNWNNATVLSIYDNLIADNTTTSRFSFLFLFI